MENKELAQQILTCVGGSLNIARHWNCITRLRFNLNDNSQVDVEKLKNIDAVMGVNFQGDQLQIMLGFGLLHQINKPTKQPILSMRHTAFKILISLK